MNKYSAIIEEMILERVIRFGIQICMVLGCWRKWQDCKGNRIKEGRRHLPRVFCNFFSKQ